MPRVGKAWSKRAVGAIGAALLLLCGVILVVNPSVWWAIPVGAVVGVMIVRPKWIARILLYGICVAAVVGVPVFVIWVLQNVCIACGPAAVDYRQVNMSVSATLDESNDEWVVEREFRMPAATLDASADALYREGHPDLQYDEDVPELRQDEKVALVENELELSGWSIAAMVDGDPVFTEEQPALVPSNVGLYPFTTELVLPVPDVDLDCCWITLYPGEGSSLAVVGPKNFVLSSLPVGVAATTPGGERYEIALNGTLDDSEVRLEAASPLVRFEPLLTLTKLSWGQFASWMLALFFGIGVNLIKDRIRKLLDAIWARIRPPKSKVPIRTAANEEPGMGAIPDPGPLPKVVSVGGRGRKAKRKKSGRAAAGNNRGPTPN